ncbi:MAG: PilZ domain-containing protein [Deltaproteobacteria bacterium]|nr:PilZ domain-containing protein [Deltaproteobacteria bacterium]
MMKILTARYESGEHFLKDVHMDETGATIHHSTKTNLSDNEQILMEIMFPEIPNRVLLRGQVASLSKNPSGADLKIAHEDLATVAFLINAAHPGSEAETTGPAARRHQRVPVGIPVDWQMEGSGDIIISATDDLGSGGVQIRTLSPPPVGTKVTLNLSLDPMSGETVAIPGKVVWIRQDNEFQGMGVQFMPGEGPQKRQIRDLLKKILLSGEIGGSST